MDEGKHDGEKPKGQSKTQYRYPLSMPDGHFPKTIPVL